MTIIRDKATGLITGGSGGRQKGSKNKITLLKLMGEQAVRENNRDKMLEVCSLVVEQALEGDKSSQKLVWQSMVSNGVSDDKNATEKVEIKIGAIAKPEEITVIQHPSQEDS